MTTTALPTAPPGRDWWVLTGMAVAATSATLASFSGLRGLALLAGWPDHLAWLLPVTLDAYAMTAARVWLSGRTGNRAAQRFARANALGAIGASIAGNAAYHAASTGLLHLTWPIVVTVGAVPAAVLGLTAHLHALQGRTAGGDAAGPDSGRTGKGADPDPAPAGHQAPAPRETRTRAGSRPKPRYRTQDDLLTAARAADEAFRRSHGGRPITRDALRTALRISGTRASELRRALQAVPMPEATDEASTTEPVTIP